MLIFADDLGWQETGSPDRTVQTPNLDRLAGEGMVFRIAYAFSRQLSAQPRLHALRSIHGAAWCLCRGQHQSWPGRIDADDSHCEPR
ncbi:MAG: hypothetical protein R3C99_27135 [Pirellulaceae bacterium]